MKNKLITIAALFVVTLSTVAQEQDNAKREFLKPMEISVAKQNEFTGKYIIEGDEDFHISVEITNKGMAIIIPDIEKSKGELETNNQYAITAQYPDKFYLNKDEFIKIHFTRSKRTKKIISLLFNANRDKSMKVIRAVKMK